MLFISSSSVRNLSDNLETYPETKMVELRKRKKQDATPPPASSFPTTSSKSTARARKQTQSTTKPPETKAKVTSGSKPQSQTQPTTTPSTTTPISISLPESLLSLSLPKLPYIPQTITPNVPMSVPCTFPVPPPSTTTLSSILTRSPPGGVLVFMFPATLDVQQILMYAGEFDYRANLDYGVAEVEMVGMIVGTEGGSGKGAGKAAMMTKCKKAREMGVWFEVVVDERGEIAEGLGVEVVDGSLSAKKGKGKSGKGRRKRKWDDLSEDEDEEEEGSLKGVTVGAVVIDKEGLLVVRRVGKVEKMLDELDNDVFGSLDRTKMGAEGEPE
jgi:hypothetical protein